MTQAHRNLIKLSYTSYYRLIGCHVRHAFFCKERQHSRGSKGIFSKVMVGGAALFSMAAVDVALADPVTFNFDGVIDVVSDDTSSGVLGNQFNVGDTFSGTFTYDDSAIDGTPQSSESGSYSYNTPPNGMTVTINGMAFSNDPNDIRVQISTTNDSTNLSGETKDQFGFFVLDAVVFPVSTGAFSMMRIDMDDLTATAIDTDGLPTDFSLPSWTTAKLSIYSEVGPSAMDSYFIGGNILSLSLNDPAPTVPSCNGLSATIEGTEGNDTIVGTSGDDVIVGLGGNDSIDGLDGADTVCGGPGNDTISGGKGNDHLRGGKGNDTIQGNKGNDFIRGKKGNDTLDGGNGDDTIRGDEGNDSCSGGNGVDSDQECEVIDSTESTIG